MSIPTKVSCFYSHKPVAFIGRWQKEHYSSIRSRYQADANLTSTQICCSVALYWRDMCTSCWPRWLVSDGWLVLCVPVSVYLCLCPCVYVVSLDDREGVHAIEEQPAVGINNSGQAQTKSNSCGSASTDINNTVLTLAPSKECDLFSWRNPT